MKATTIKRQKHDPNENHDLFNKFILPNLDEIKSLCFYYSSNKQEVDANYNEVLTEMYKYVHTYNPTQSLKTWLHIVTKRITYNCNKRQSQEAQHNHGLAYDFDHNNGDDDDVLECGVITHQIIGDLKDNISDELYNALLQTPPAQLSAFILYYQGYSIKDIVEIEYQRGYIDVNGPEAKLTIANRVYMAKKSLKKIFLKNGVSKSNQLL